MSDPQIVHGTSAYTNHGCRCDICRTAASAAKADRRARNGRERLSEEAKTRLRDKRIARLHTDEGRSYEREAKRRQRAKKDSAAA